mgnify:CR=1 FL=1
MSKYDLEFNKEENSLSLSEESLNQALKDNEDKIDHALQEFGQDKRSRIVQKHFDEFLQKLNDLFDKI